MEECYDDLIDIWGRVNKYLDATEIEIRRPFFEYVDENKENKYIQKYSLKLSAKYKKYLEVLEKESIDEEDAVWIAKYYLIDNFIRPYIIMRFIEKISDLYVIKRINEIEEFYLFFVEQDMDFTNFDDIKLKNKIKVVLIKICEYKKAEIEEEISKEFTIQEIRKVRCLKMFIKRIEQVIKKCKI